MPHDNAVDGTFIDILGKTPFLNAPMPSCCFIYLKVDKISEYLLCLTSNSQLAFKSAADYCTYGLAFVLDYVACYYYVYFYYYIDSSCEISHIFSRCLHDGRTSYVWSLVFITSNGFVINPANPPATPAHRKYHMCEFYLSHGFI